MLSDLPRHAEAKVALHLFDRRGDPSFLEGIKTFPCGVKLKRPHYPISTTRRLEERVGVE
jgi:hypothetical protein